MIALRLPITLSAVLALTACATVQDPNNPNRNAQQGALIGAGVGALAGLATGDDATERRQQALAGAALGAAAGGGVGLLLDRQEAQLRAQLGPQVGIRNTGDRLIVSMPQDILFATDSASLTGSLQSDLRAVAQSINDFPGTTVRVIGHTDSTGSEAYNLDLSQRRAQAVSSVLAGAGVSPARLSTVGRGEAQPIATNDTAAGRAQNRRVEIVIIPN
ncbi:MAG: OmpA family protein [Paracoccaceae bacterium]